jgi:hypothetical protein
VGKKKDFSFDPARAPQNAQEKMEKNIRTQLAQNDGENQSHNSKKETLGPNTNR